MCGLLGWHYGLGFVFALEKRGYVKAGPWTPEATVVCGNNMPSRAPCASAFLFCARWDRQPRFGHTTQVEHPEAVSQLHREYLRGIDLLAINFCPAFHFAGRTRTRNSRTNTSHLTELAQCQITPEQPAATSCRHSRSSPPVFAFLH